MLQYDDSAFYFFCIAMMSFYLLPSWYYVGNRLYSAISVKDDKIGAVARTSAEKKKVSDLKKESRGVSAVLTQGFLINTGITVFLTLVYFYLLYCVVTAEGELSSFDPFEILGIDHGADAKTIKKAYRKLSLMYHPDKNPDNRAAEAKFMMVSKAYEALTDETAKENWEKYGNPDGKQAMELYVGLPSFLLEPNNRNLVLVAYLIAMVGIVPYCVYTYYSASSKYGEKDVMYDTYAWFHHMLTEHVLLKSLPEIMAGSAEFRTRNLPATAEEKQAVATLAGRVKSQMPKPKYHHPVVVKGNVLLHAHLLRQTDALSEKDHDDLRYMLRVSTSLIDAMISVCKHQDNIQTAIHCIEFGQYMTQGMWVKDSPLLQLPHYTAEEAKHCEKGKTKVSTLQQYRDQKRDDRKGMVNFTDAQKADVHQFVEQIYPNFTVEAKVFVDDDEDDKVYEGDVCTILVTITRHHLPDDDEDAKVGLVHAPRFPFPKQEALWVILGQMKEGKIMSIEKVTKPTKVVTHKIMFLAPMKGHYEFDLIVKSNAYVGADQKIRVGMDTLDNSTLPEYKVHPDDADLDEEPTLFEELLNAHIEDDSDDEDDDDDDEPAKADSGANESSGAGTAADKRRERLRKARQQADDDDDDDSDDDVQDVTPK